MMEFRFIDNKLKYYDKKEIADLRSPYPSHFLNYKVFLFVKIHEKLQHIVNTEFKFEDQIAIGKIAVAYYFQKMTQSIAH